MSYHDIAQAVTSLYASLNFSPPPRQYTVLSAFILVDRSHEAVIKIISLATGSKCLPTSRLPKEGDALHDSHAEVLARRGAVRWFLEEIARSDPSADSTPWLKRCKNGLFSLKNEIVKIAPRGRANCVAPGWVDTPMATDALKDPEIVYRALAS